MAVPPDLLEGFHCIAKRLHYIFQTLLFTYYQIPVGDAVFKRLVITPFELSEFTKIPFWPLKHPTDT